MKKLLFLTPELPYPLQSGGKFKTWKLLEGLCAEFEVSVVCPLKMDDSKHVEAFKQSLPIAQMVNDPVDVPRSMKTLLQSYGKGIPLNIHRTASKKISAWVKENVSEFDLVFMDSYEVGQFLPEEDDLPEGISVVYHAHNVYHQLWQRYASITKNPLHKVTCLAEAVRVKRYELGVCSRAEMVYASDNDSALLKQCGVADGKVKYTCHLGDDSQLSLPDLEFDQENKQICFVGFLGWEPNSQGLNWFIDNVWADLSAKHPDLKFKIAGRGAPDELVEKVSHQPNIELLGFVEDLESVYAGSSVCVAPVLFGSGIKVKVLHAMARGIPVVTTDVGAEGIRTANLDGMVIVNQPLEMSNAIQSLISHRNLWEHFATRSREIVQKLYTWDALLGSMKKDLYEVFPQLGTAQTARPKLVASERVSEQPYSATYSEGSSNGYGYAASA